MDLAPYFAFAAIFTVACASPGPTIAALVARVLARGVAGAPAFCAGLVLGDLAWLTIAGLGLAVLAQTVQPLFVALKYAGAAYLLWLAWKLWTVPPAPAGEVPPVRGEGWQLAAAGLAVALGNPKAMLFFLALLPTVIDLPRLSLGGYLVLGAIVLTIYPLVLAAYVTLAARARRLFRSARAMRAVNRATAGVMAGAAVAVASR